LSSGAKPVLPHILPETERYNNDIGSAARIEKDSIAQGLS
jgi:hypothetical protein